MGEGRSIDTGKLQALIEAVASSGGSERANYQLFVERLCEALALSRPDFAREENELNDYVFERRIDFKHPDGSRTAGFIDCYRRDCFILEAKQSGKRAVKKADEDRLGSLPEDHRQQKLGHARRGTRGWDKVMVAARKQAEDYARALPVEHGYPPFLLVVDVGNVIEVFADFSGQGKNYAHFPDRQRYRIWMDDLLDEDVQRRLITIWTDPRSLDPAKRSAEVTRDIAERLAVIARRLETRHDPKDVAEFLMRCLFTMFAEDVGLLPAKGFETLMAQMKETPKNLVPALESLWRVMDQGGYSPHFNATVKRFNGSLFKSVKALPLETEDIDDLWEAARRRWEDVEPAIFGTLLERALESRERSKLGAHYTPRAYVERLVVPTIIEPLREDWDEVGVRVQELQDKGEEREALRAVRRFHRKLCTTRVLDPACGTGNFLYVSLELMKKLEGEVLTAIADLGGEPDRYSDYPEEAGRDLVGRKLARSAGRFSVDPHQFYGLEINPRAVAIADLVLWIGFLKWQLRTGGPDAVHEPVLDAYGTIREQDAILAYDERDLMRDEAGKPLSRWDGVTMKPHPVTGEEVPDPAARIELYTYKNPRKADWPETEFIVGNPPFIGGKDMRAELGDGYAEACWKARPHVPGGADFVMHFWDEAAERLARKGTAKAPNRLHRFGFITTNSITQTFSRRVVERALNAKAPVSLTFAVPNHPWLKASDKAAVRIAMTVAEKGGHDGVLAEVVSEEGLNTDTPQVALELQDGRIRGNLSIGADFARLRPLLALALMAHKGVQLNGKGFILDLDQANRFLDLFKYRNRTRGFVNGRDLVQKPRNVYVIDTDSLSELGLAEEYPEFYHILRAKVKPERDQNPRPSRRDRWWVYGENAPVMRAAVAQLERYIATCRTAAHRTFAFRSTSTISESKVIVIAGSEGDQLTIVSSRLHVHFANIAGGWQGAGNDPVYQHTDTFNPFPFPACVTDDSNPALRQRLAELGERLDAFRKERLAEHAFLTMTGLYNVLERVRELENGCDVEPLNDKERVIYDAGLIAVLKELHDDIDRATFEAYGWQDLGEKLVGKPGATTPSSHKSADQEAAEEDLLSRLVALNLERQAEEKRGLVRWLRPDYQIPKLGHKVVKPAEGEQVEAEVGAIEIADKPKWPSDALDQIRLVRDILAKARGPAPAAEISARFKGGRKRAERVEQVLAHMVETGIVRERRSDDERRYFLPR